MIKLALVATLFTCMWSCNSKPPVPVSPIPKTILLTWHASKSVGCCAATPLLVYIVYRSVHGTNSFIALNPTGTTALNFIDTTPVANVEYDYEVKASDENGISDVSNVVTVTLPQ